MFQIIVCSAGRAQILRSQTLKMLERAKPSSPIHIIVPEAQVETYRAALSGAIPHTLHGCEKGLTKQRQYARNLFPATERLLFVDDDIQRLRELVGERLADVEDLDRVLEDCFREAEAAGATLWGIYPIANRGWQTERVRRDRIYCVGAFYGIINSIPLEPVLDEAEDWARELEILHRGGHILRFDRFGIQTRYWKGDTGGIQRTTEETERIYNDLASRYSEWVVLMNKRKTGKLNLRFKKQ